MAEGRGIGPRSRKNEPDINRFSSTALDVPSAKWRLTMARLATLDRGANRAFLLSLYCTARRMMQRAKRVSSCLLSAHLCARLWMISTAFTLDLCGKLFKNGSAILRNFPERHPTKRRKNLERAALPGCLFPLTPVSVLLTNPTLSRYEACGNAAILVQKL
jgi:hypothetical protein